MKKYRVVWIYGTNAPGCYGWASSAKSYESEEAALAAAQDPTLRPRAWKQVHADCLNGRYWDQLVKIVRVKTQKAVQP